MLDSPQGPTGPPYAPSEDRVQLREYVAVLRARKWGIIALTAFTLLAALFFSFRQTPIYESEAQVLVNPIPPSGFTIVLPPAPNLDTERTVAVSREVAELAAEQLGGAHDPDDLLEDLAVEVETNSEVLFFTYSDPRPLEAQRRTQAFAEAYLEFRREKALESIVQVQESIQARIQKVSGELSDVNEQIAAATDEVERTTLQTRASQLAAQLAVLEQQKSQLAPVGQLRVGDVIAAANLPSSPASPNHILNGALALLIGLALGVGFAFLRERLDDRLRGQGDLEARAGAPVLAVVSRIPTWKKREAAPLVAMEDPKSGTAEAYRTLRTGLLFAAHERDARIVMVTSPHPGEGKTVTTANLAVLLAQAGRRVIAVSADMRKPRLHRFFRTSNRTGLSRLLTGEDEASVAVQDVGIPNLRIVASGPVPKNPTELMGSHAMGKALKNFREVSDIVLIDAPPVLDVADTITLAPLVDAVVLVADAERTSRGALSHARKQLDQVRAEVVGAVLNNLDPSKARTYPYSYRYYHSHYDHWYGEDKQESRILRHRSEPERREDAWAPAEQRRVAEPSQPPPVASAPVPQSPPVPSQSSPVPAPGSGVPVPATPTPPQGDVDIDEMMKSLFSDEDASYEPWAPPTRSGGLPSERTGAQRPGDERDRGQPGP
jgi:capsular exopolysaccharide synthesis family protein